MLPLAFDYGLYQMIMAFAAGARLVLERSFAFPAQVLKVMAEERVTGFPGVPTIFALLGEFKSLRDYDLSSIRYVTNTAAALPAKHITMLHGPVPGRAHLLDVRPHRVQALHLPAAEGPRPQARQRRHRDPEHRAVDRRRERPAASAPAWSASS